MVNERDVKLAEGEACAKQLRCDFTEASAKTCVNVEKAFYSVVRQIRSKKPGGAAGKGKSGKKGGGCTLL